MSKKITAKGGPLDGKTYLVPENLTRIDVPADQGAGHYKINEKTATWKADHPDTAPEPEAPDA